MRKRRLSAVLAILLALSMSFSSFAMEITDNVVTEEVSGASEEVTSTEERVLTEESFSVEESTQAEESFTEEYTSTEDSSSTEENASTEESSSTEENVQTEEVIDESIENEAAEESTSEDDSKSEELDPCETDGHTYIAGSWTWVEGDEEVSASLAFVCEICGSNISIDADVSVTDEQEATAYEEGWITYEAVVVLNGETYTDEYVITLPIETDEEEEIETGCAAETVTSSTSNGLLVTISWSENAFDEPPEVSVSDISEDAAIAAVEEAVDDEDCEVIDAVGVDITFSISSEEVQPYSPVTISIELPANQVLETAEDEADTKVVVVHQHDGEQAEILSDASATEEGASFEADEFSYYVIGTYSSSSEDSQTIANSATGLKAAITAISESDEKTGTIVITSDINCGTTTITIPSGVTVTLMDDGTARSITCKATSTASLFKVESGGTLIIDGENLTIARDDTSATSTSTNYGALIECHGTLTLNSGTIDYKDVNLYRNTSESAGNETNGGAVVVSGNGALFTMTGGTIENAKCTTNYCGLVRVCNGASFVMDGGTITGFLGKKKNVYNAAVAIYASSAETSFTINGGTITGNEGYVTSSSYGAGVLLYSNYEADFTMNGGSIEENEGYYGAGICAYGDVTLTIFGGSVNSNKAEKDGAGIYADGDVTLTISGGSVDSNKAGRYGAGIYANGNVTLTISGGSVSENTATNDGGGIYAGGGVTLTISGGNVDNNETDNSGGGIYLVGSSSGDSTLTMTDGSMSKNSASYFGGGIAAENYTILHLNGGTISNNNASEYIFAAGGGVYVYGEDSKIYIDGVTISSNYAYAGGGGIAKWRCYLEIKSGTITGNSAGAGGGIYINNGDENYIYGGTIANNEADGIESTGHGGGVYINDGTLYLENVLITNNTASVLGGGIWGCNTSGIELYVTNGGAIFGNDATENEKTSSQAGDDYTSVSKDKNEYTMYLSDRILGGGYAEWYVDGGIDTSISSTSGYADTSASRYDNESTHTKFSTSSLTQTASYALINAIDEGDSNGVLYTESDGTVVYAATALSEAEATVIISGNSASRGGGIGANGNVVIGNKTAKTTSVTVTKSWDDSDDADGIRPGSVTVYLYNTVDGKKYLIDSAVLSENNSWAYTFDELPVDDDYVYSVEEDVPENYAASYVTTENEDGSYSVTITNTHEQEATTTITVTKKWNDSNNANGIRPDDVTVYLYNTVNGVKYLVDSAVLSKDNNWAYTFDELPIDDDYTYNVEEKVPADYTASYVTRNNEDGSYSVAITNTHKPEETETTTTTTTTTTTPSSSSNSSSSSSASAVLSEEYEVETVETPAEETNEVLGETRDVEAIAATGDDSNLLFWLILLAAAGIGLVGVIFENKRQNS